MDWMTGLDAIHFRQKINPEKSVLEFGKILNI